MTRLPEFHDSVCAAWIDNTDGGRRGCVLKTGHYNGPSPDADPPFGLTDDESWHTNCPDVSGQDRPLNRHGDSDHFPCGIWSDAASGAHPDDRISTNSEPAAPSPEGPMLISGDTLPQYRAAVNFQDPEGRVIVSATLFGPAGFLADAVAAISDSFKEEAER